MTEADQLEERLTNWGRWIRTYITPGSTTCTAIDLTTEGGDEEREYRPPIDVKDAQVVNHAWCQMQSHHEQLRAEKAVLAILYTDPNHNSGYYRVRMFRAYKIRVQGRHFEALIASAKKSIQKILDRLDKRAQIE